MRRFLSQSQISQFHRDGFLILDSFIPKTFCAPLATRIESLFGGNFETGIWPDEWYGREGVSLEKATKEINNAWKSDRFVASLVLSESLHGFISELGGWNGSRIAQDSIIIKPPGGGTSIEYHQDRNYISEQFTPLENNSITCWIPLDDVSPDVGTLEYVRGSHKWKLSDPSLAHFHSGSDAVDAHRGPMLDLADKLGEEVDVVKVSIPKGGVAFHHQNTWHGSGPNLHPTQPRRVIAFHALNSDCIFNDKPSTYIYGRYRLRDSNHLREEFFPLCFHNDSPRSDILLEACSETIDHLR